MVMVVWWAAGGRCAAKGRAYRCSQARGMEARLRRQQLDERGPSNRTVSWDMKDGGVKPQQRPRTQLPCLLCLYASVYLSVCLSVSSLSLCLKR